jgi:hypothetical protein
MIPECILLAASYCVPVAIGDDFRPIRPSRSRIENSRVLGSLDREKHAFWRDHYQIPKKPMKRDGWMKGEVILGSLALAASLTDAIQTQKARNYRHRHGLSFVEYDPLARPFIPHPGLHYTAASILPIGGVLLSHYLRSKGVRFWYIPQVVGIVGNGWGIGFTRANGFPYTSLQLIPPKKKYR